MNIRSIGLFVLVLMLSVAPVAAQRPTAAYLLPAGGQRGTTFEVMVGGRQITRAHGVVISGSGVRGRVVETYPQLRIFDGAEMKLIREWVNNASEKLGYGEFQKTIFPLVPPPPPPPAPKPATPAPTPPPAPKPATPAPTPASAPATPAPAPAPAPATPAPAPTPAPATPAPAPAPAPATPAPTPAPAPATPLPPMSAQAAPQPTDPPKPDAPPLPEWVKRRAAEKAAQPAPPPSAKAEEVPPPDPEVVAPKYPLLKRLRDNPTDADFRWFAYEFFFSRPKPTQSPIIVNMALIEITIDADAEPGDRELRLMTPQGMTKPVIFQVGTIPEIRETERNDAAWAAVAEPLNLPIVINGQIREEDIDRFRFHAKKGQKLVLSALARHLVPFMADAVPGWFQPVIRLFDADDREVAYADGGGVRSDPVLYFDVPEDGIWTVEIHDSVFRGREDFVYRLAIGELPWVEGIAPLGGNESGPFEIRCFGRNLPDKPIRIEPEKYGMSHIGTLNRIGDTPLLLPIRYATDVLPERNLIAASQTPAAPGTPDTAITEIPVQTPLILNGCIGKPGDVGLFRITGKAGETIVADVLARRLDSPLDAVLYLTDSTGKVLAGADDRTGELNFGRFTHQADPHLSFTFPADGDYRIAIADVNQCGGPAYAYRLRLSAPRPDFLAMMEPSGFVLNKQQSAAVTFRLLRRDGFNGPVSFRLSTMADEYRLDAKPIPENETKGTGRLTAPKIRRGDDPETVKIEAVAQIDGKEVVRPVVGVDDHEQAFIYHHFIPGEAIIVAAPPPPPPKPEMPAPPPKPAMPVPAPAPAPMPKPAASVPVPPTPPAPPAPAPVPMPPPAMPAPAPPPATAPPAQK